jgi:hypothetical protein
VEGVVEGGIVTEQDSPSYDPHDNQNDGDLNKSIQGHPEGVRCIFIDSLKHFSAPLQIE